MRTIDSLGMPNLVEEQPDTLDHACLVLLVANVYRELARYSVAEQYYLQALAGLARNPFMSHPNYARGIVELGTLYQLMGQFDEAQSLFERACAIHQKAVEPDLVAHARCLQALAGLHDALGHRREATACLTQARTLIEQAGDPPLEIADLLLKEAWVLCRLENRPCLCQSRWSGADLTGNIGASVPRCPPGKQPIGPIADLALATPGGENVA